MQKCVFACNSQRADAVPTEQQQKDKNGETKLTCTGLTIVAAATNGSTAIIAVGMLQGAHRAAPIACRETITHTHLCEKGGNVHF